MLLTTAVKFLAAKGAPAAPASYRCIADKLTNAKWSEADAELWMQIYCNCLTSIVPTSNTYTGDVSWLVNTGGASVIPQNAQVQLEIRIMAWLGNQLRPESLFSKDLDIDPFIASTPEAIAAEFNEMQAARADKYEGGWAQVYLNRIKNISFGFGGSGFFASQSGEKAPWYLNPNITFPTMIAIVLSAFITVLSTGSVKEKGERPVFDYPEVSSRQETSPRDRA
jgi:hypothetical protein